MCLGVPGQVVELRNGNQAVVDFWGVRKSVRLDQLKSPIVPGEYVIEHAGFAVRVIPAADVADTLALYEVLLSEAGEDPIARDVVDALDCIEVELEAPAMR
jgi:hydrogenase expression/formation protein HypC